VDESPHDQKTCQRRNSRDSQHPKLTAEEKIQEDYRREAVLRIAKAKRSSLPPGFCEVKDEAEKEKFEQGLLAIAQCNAKRSTAKEEQQKQNGLSTWQVVELTQKLRYQDCKEAVQNCPHRFRMGEPKGPEREQEDVKLMQVVRDLREENALFDVMAEELTVRVNMMEREICS
jgi:hypothetical protein